VTATPPPVRKKSFFTYVNRERFFCSLGVFIVGIHSSIATGLCSFFWKIAKGHLSKKQHFAMAIF
jgi:hypothetical protein